MKRWEIYWSGTQYAKCVVEADTEEEARKKADNDEYDSFDLIEAPDDWVIDETKEIEESN